MTESIETSRDWCHHWSTVGERVENWEFLRQVERTIAGQPMSDAQIDLCVQAIQSALGLQATDMLLDLCCGNGLVTIRLSSACSQVVGVDISSDLIEVARRNYFAENVTYIHGSATEISATELGGFVPSKIVMCVALQYFTEANCARLMKRLGTLTAQPVPIFFTDVPDVNHLYDFYNTPERQAEFARRRAAGTEAIGTWWSKQRLSEILAGFGYAAVFKMQDPCRFGAHYRFDLLAEPIG